MSYRTAEEQDEFNEVVLSIVEGEPDSDYIAQNLEWLKDDGNVGKVYPEDPEREDSYRVAWKGACEKVLEKRGYFTED